MHCNKILLCFDLSQPEEVDVNMPWMILPTTVLPKMMYKILVHTKMYDMHVPSRLSSIFATRSRVLDF